MALKRDVIVGNSASTEQGSTIIQVGLDTQVIHAPVPAPAADQPQTTSGPNSVWVKAAGKKETSVPLQRLPPGLDLSAGVDEPIHFDAARRLLLYRGFMCHGSYLYLRKLSSDLDYLTALDVLYVRTANQSSGRKRSSVLLGAAGAVVALLAGGLWYVLR
jgi:hypothetical protein